MKFREDFRYGEEIIVKSGWLDAGHKGTVIGPSVLVGQWWVPVLWYNEEDPDWIKFSAVESTNSKDAL